MRSCVDNKSVGRADRLFDGREERNPTQKRQKPILPCPLPHPFHFRYVFVNNNINHCFRFCALIFFTSARFLIWTYSLSSDVARNRGFPARDVRLPTSPLPQWVCRRFRVSGRSLLDNSKRPHSSIESTKLKT